MVDICTTAKFPQSWGFRREPARPHHLRIDYCNGLKFNDNFDWDHIWYDAIQINITTVILIGPPLYDIIDWMKTNGSFILDSGQSCEFNFVILERVCYTIITVPNVVNTITFHAASEKIELKINYNTGYYNDLKTMVTLQKNNPVQWIQQWIQYHYDVLGVQGFLIYDNASTDYTIEFLEENIQYKDAKIKVVSWPYPYGPQGSDFTPWDSDYCQYVMLEHSKWRYLANASLVLNNDIDDYIFLDGLTLDTILSNLTKGNAKCLRYKGIWIEPVDITTGVSAFNVPVEERHVKNYYCTDDSNETGIGYKWMLIPKNCINYQWNVHQIGGPMLKSLQIWYGHYLSHNTGWSWKRDEFKGNITNLKEHKLLRSHLDKMVIK